MLLVGILLTREDIFRLALLLVGSLHEYPTNARSHLHYPQRITKLGACNRMGDEVLWIRIYVEKDGDGSAETGTQAAEIEDGARWADVWNLWA